MRIFVINLDRRPDRLRSISRRLADAGLRWERVSALDGHDARLDRGVDWEKFGYYSQLLPPQRGAIGCYFSHQLVWKKMIAEHIPQALILEDDVAPSSAWSSEILGIDMGKLGLDSLRLDASRVLGKMPMEKYFEIPVGAWTAKNMRSWGAGAYILTLGGAKKRLALGKMWIMADDYFMMNRIVRFRTALLYPQMWCHPEETPSDIAPPAGYWKQIAGYKKLYARAITALLRERERRRYANPKLAPRPSGRSGFA